MRTYGAPRNRREFRVAIICALKLELENVQSLFDVCWEDENMRYGKMAGDSNTYTTGVIGNHNVVLVHMPGTGSTSAAAVAAGLRSSFLGIELALVVGVCGVAPLHPQTQEDIFLGDIVFSTSLIQYDFGRQYPNGFQRKKEIGDSLGRAGPEIRGFMQMLQLRENRHRLTQNLALLLQSESFQAKVPQAKYPGATRDRLYEASYIHQHQPGIRCDSCNNNLEPCSKSCDEVGCKEENLVLRNRHCLRQTKELALHPIDTPFLHFGRFGSANTVMKSRTDRDELAKADGVVAFEMEGAGVWDQYPTVVIKAACDYADSHKNKDLQLYAAAMAAGGVKLFLQEWASVNVTGDVVHNASIPFESVDQTNHQARPVIRQMTEVANPLFQPAIDRSRRAVGHSNEAIQGSQQERCNHHMRIDNLNDSITTLLNVVLSLVISFVTAGILGVAFNELVQSILASHQETNQMMTETEQSLQTLTESQREIEAARKDIVAEHKHLGRVQAGLQQRDSTERAYIEPEAFNDDYSLNWLFGEGHDDTGDATLYNSESQIGQAQSEASHARPETISYRTDQIATQSPPRHTHSDHESINQEVESLLLRHQINGLRGANRQLRRSLRQTQLEIQEKEAILEKLRLEKQQMNRTLRELEEERCRRENGWFGGWCTIL